MQLAICDFAEAGREDVSKLLCWKADGGRTKWSLKNYVVNRVFYWAKESNGAIFGRSVTDFYIAS